MRLSEPIPGEDHIAGGTDASLAGVAVVGGGTGVRKFIIGSLF